VTELTALFEDYHRDDSFDSAFKLIVSLRKNRRVDDAVGVLEEMTTRDLPAIWSCQFAVCAFDLGENDASIALFERGMPMLTSDTDRMVCMLDLAGAKFASGRYHEAQPIYRSLRQSDWLAIQNVYSGNEQYWWRPFADRLLYDQSVDGKRIMVVHDEGGFGDLFQMIRYIDELKREGASRVSVVVPNAVGGLIATKLGAEAHGALLPQGEWELFSSPFSLWGRYQAHRFSPNWDEGYLSADLTCPPPLSALAGLARPTGRPRIGVVWRSATTARHEPFRSMTLSDLVPILECGGVDWHSLQVDVDSEEELAFLRHFNVRHLGGALHSFSGTAQVLQQLDLLISIDSAPVHLAGALGLPAWALLSRAPDYRWCDDVRFTPWYPSVRLFRQRRLGDWSNVIEDVSREIRAL
jgi:hypothetical protein